jgi:hypothetical protein
LVDQDAFANRPIDRRADRVAIRVDLSEVGDDDVDRHEGPDSSTDRTHECPSISRRNTLEHHQQVEVGVWAFLAPSDRPEQDHLDRIERLDDLSNDERQRFAQRQAVVPARLVDYVQCRHVRKCTMRVAHGDVVQPDRVPGMNLAPNTADPCATTGAIATPRRSNDPRAAPLLRHAPRPTPRTTPRHPTTPRPHPRTTNIYTTAHAIDLTKILSAAGLLG